MGSIEQGCANQLGDRGGIGLLYIGYICIYYKHYGGQWGQFSLRVSPADDLLPSRYRVHWWSMAQGFGRGEEEEEKQSTQEQMLIQASLNLILKQIYIDLFIIPKSALLLWSTLVALGCCKGPFKQKCNVRVCVEFPNLTCV